MADLLIQKGAYVDAVNDMGETPLLLAIKSGNVFGSHLLKQNRKNYCKLSLRLGYTKIAEALIGKNANVNIGNSHGWTPLHFAAEKGM